MSRVRLFLMALFVLALCLPQVMHGQRLDSITSLDDLLEPETGEIHGMKWHDVDQDGVKEVGEPGLPGWEITLEGEGLSLSTVSDQNGEYHFVGLPAGSYDVAEVMQPDWQQTFPPGGIHSIALTSGQVVLGKNFGNWRAYYIHLPFVRQLPPPVTRELQAAHDATALQGYPTFNFGDVTDMWAGYDDYLDPDGRIARSFVRFDLSSIPKGSPVQTAKLYIYLVGSYDYPNRYRTITIHRATSSWSEDNVTWNSMPGYAEQYDAVSIQHEAWGWCVFDITELVKGWVNGSWENYGLVVRGPEHSGADSSWRAFGTSESDYIPYTSVVYIPVSNSASVEMPAGIATERDTSEYIIDSLYRQVLAPPMPKTFSRLPLAPH